MQNKFKVTTRKNYGNRLAESFKAVIFGVILFIASFFILWINEGNFVKVQSGLDEGKKAVVKLEAPEVDSDNDGKLIHVQGQAISSTELLDDDFGVSAKGLVLNRKVEMYQWRESSSSSSKESVGGAEETTTEYTYKQEWSDSLIDSDSFEMKSQYVNPGSMPFESKKFSDPDAKLGEFKLPNSLLTKIDRHKDVPLGSLDTTLMPGVEVEGKFLVAPEAIARALTAGQYAQSRDLSTLEAIGTDPVGIRDGFESAVQNPIDTAAPATPSSLPQIGDIRISYTVTTDGPVSVVASQTGSSFEPFNTKSGTKIELIKAGDHSSESLFKEQEEQNKLMTWLIRLGGFLAMFIGLSLILGPLSMLLAFLPILKNATRFVFTVIAFLVSLILSALVIAIAWLFHRPILSLILILGAIAIGVAIKFLVIDKLKKKEDSSGGSGSGSGDSGDAPINSTSTPLASVAEPSNPQLSGFTNQTNPSNAAFVDPVAPSESQFSGPINTTPVASVVTPVAADTPHSPNLATSQWQDSPVQINPNTQESSQSTMASTTPIESAPVQSIPTVHEVQSVAPVAPVAPTSVNSQGIGSVGVETIQGVTYPQEQIASVSPGSRDSTPSVGRQSNPGSGTPQR